MRVVIELEERNSMLYWYPKIKGLKIPQPKTEIIIANESEKKGYWEADSCRVDRFIEEIKKIIPDKFNLPVFIRTDIFSNKWFWEKSCFVDDLDKLEKNLFEIISESRCADLMGLPFNAIAVREYIPMKNIFTSFYGNMPVNPEIRFFIKDGDIICWNWYWIEEAIERSREKPDNWKNLLQKERDSINEDEIMQLKDYSSIVSEQFEGAWSVDFCKAGDGRWILIDMAVAKDSWHPEDCPHKKSIGDTK